MFSKRILIFYIYSAVAWSVVAISGCEKGMSMAELVPRKMHGWKAEGKDEIYNRDSIFDYINGAGEIYRAYGFRELLVRRFVKAGQPDIVVELFDMGSPGDAFGVFTQGRGGEGGDIGQGSEYRGSLLCFWKGNFFGCVFAEQETEAAKEAVLDLGRAIAGAIKVIGEKPRLLDYLPKEGLMERSVHYFHTYPSLNYHYYLASENILNLDESTEAVLAGYQPAEGKSYLLLVRYPDGKRAKGAFERFIGAYIPEAAHTGITQLENGKWTGAKVYQKFVIVAFDAPTRNYAEAWLEAVREKIATQVEE